MNRKSIFISIPILFIIGSIMHFVYDFTGRLAVIGAFAPVNESPWEHLKLAFFPMLIWWIIYYFKGRKSEGFSGGKWAISAAAALITAPLFIIAFFYSYTGAFGVESLFLDIMSLLLAIAAGQYLGFHIYKYGDPKPDKFVVFISLIVIIILIFAFIKFTFSPPHLPVFMDKNTGDYGISG